MAAGLTASAVGCNTADSQGAPDAAPSLARGLVAERRLIGANGAGKTTTMRAISGLCPLSGGGVRFDGDDIARKRPDQRVARGIVQVPEGRGVFPAMTVRENLAMGVYARRDHAAVRADQDRVFSLLPQLWDRRAQVGGTLSGGEQQMLAIGRALMSRPRLLLLDEPSMGLAPTVIRQGTPILLVEQNAQQALAHAHRAYVLETGRIVKTGAGSDLLEDQAAQEAYLGVA